MRLPTPIPGLVVRYAFLWSHEQGSGAEEAAKDRPCAIVISSKRLPDGDTIVVVAPITHAAPSDPAAAIELPRAVSRRLGLDTSRHWLRIEELNRFAWPGFDLRPVPGRNGDIAYGMLQRELFEQLRRGILARQALRRLSIQER